ncbi:MAG: hypothetical protein ICV63_04215 [Coleofasciculus sp. Co-bin14]|nr:hypothetical protein [Coleofasciculus sp. Co-bin14]
MSPWRNPLPSEEYKVSRVTVYFHNGGWVPIAVYPLADAIELYRKASRFGMELFVFPCELDPKEYSNVSSATNLGKISA